jgi:GR25 family glycosyltransferase involved in LPS biosynthesis
MQLSTPAMLGCLLSHIHIWKGIQPNEIVAVFEEDAYLDEVSGSRMRGLSNDMRAIPWDVLLLESGHGLISSGKWMHIGEYAATCGSSSSLYIKPENRSKPCTWFGTRGYLITYNGAQRLLHYAFPISVQVDALMGLVAAFSRDFRMYWTRENIAHLQLFRITSVWDGCIKCYMPTSPIHYFIALVVMALFMWHYLTLYNVKGLPSC